VVPRGWLRSSCYARFNRTRTLPLLAPTPRTRPQFGPSRNSRPEPARRPSAAASRFAPRARVHRRSVPEKVLPGCTPAASAKQAGRQTPSEPRKNAPSPFSRGMAENCATSPLRLLLTAPIREGLRHGRESVRASAWYRPREIPRILRALREAPCLPGKPTWPRRDAAEHGPFAPLTLVFFSMPDLPAGTADSSISELGSRMPSAASYPFAQYGQVQSLGECEPLMRGMERLYGMLIDTLV
jgi:hypothetical protein